MALDLKNSFRTEEEENSQPVSFTPAHYHAQNTENFASKTVKFIGSAGVAGINSLVNSAKSVANLALSEENEFEMRETQDILNKYDSAWGDFYRENKGAIDFTGDFAALFVPGTVALKGMKAAKLAEREWSASRAAFDVFNTQKKRSAFLEQSKAMDAAKPMLADFRVKQLKFAAMEALNEGAVLTGWSYAALNKSSLFEEYDLWNDPLGTAWKFTKDSLFGGAISLPFKYLAGNKAVGEALKAAGIQENRANRIRGRDVGMPADEAFVQAVEDRARGTSDSFKQDMTLRIKTLFGEVLQKGRTKEEAGELYLSFDKYLEKITPEEANQFWRNTESVERFDPAVHLQKGKQGELLQSSVVLNTRNGRSILSGEVVPTAGDLGYGANLRARTFTLGKKQGLQRVDDFKAQAAEVDGSLLFHMDLAKSNPLAFSLPGGAKFQDSPIGFAIDDWKQLQAAYARANSTGRAQTLYSGADFQLFDSQELGLMLGKEKLALATKARDAGMKMEDISVRFNVEVEKLFETAGAEGFAVYKDLGKLERYKAPTNLVVKRRDTGFASQEEMLSKLDIAAQQRARQEAAVHSTNATWGQLGDEFDFTQLKNVDTSLITQQSDTAGLITQGGKQDYATPIEMLETNGTIIKTMSDKLGARLVKPFEVVSNGIKDSPEKLAEVGSILNLIRQNPAKLVARYAEDGTMKIVDIDTKTFLRNQATGGDLVVSKESADFLKTMQESNAILARLRNTNTKITGKGKLLDENLLYAPPPDLRNFEYFALATFPTGTRRAIYAQTKEQLAERIALARSQLPEGTTIQTKQEIKNLKSLYEDYNITSSFFDDAEADILMARIGSAADLFPTVSKDLIADLGQYFVREGNRAVRRAAQTVQSSMIDELQFLGNRYAQLESSVAGKNLGSRDLLKGNPWHDAIKTTLNFSKFEEFRLLADANKNADVLVSAAFNNLRAGALEGLEKGNLEQIKGAVNKHLRAVGNSFDYEDAATYLLANKRYNQKALSETVTLFNGALSTLALGLDMLYPIVNAISYPIVAWPELRSMARRLGGQADVDSLLNVAIPGGNGAKLPAPSKIIASVIKDTFSKEGREAMRQKYKNVGTVDSTAIEAQEALDDLLQTLVSSPGSMKKKVKDKIEFIKGYTVKGPNSWLQLIAHETADRMIRAAGVTDESVIRSMRSQFSKRVNGNYTTSQRPAILQGPLGHAAGLFQTWTLQILQNMARYAGGGETKQIAAFMGAHSAIFGAQSNPLFHALNSHYANRNEANIDLYSTIGQDNEVADFLLYGAPSSTFNFSLYTRGDLTPRNPTILPTSLAEVPAASAIIKSYAALTGAARKIANGGEIPQSVLEGIALSGLNRPISGSLQVILGKSMLNAGALGGQVIDDDIRDATAWTRVVGSRPLTEQKVLDAYYRHLDVEAKDREKLQVLGAAIRTKMDAGEFPEGDEISSFMENYISSGGNPRQFKRFFQNQITLSQVPLAERMAKRLRDDPQFGDWRAYMEAQDAPDLE